MILLRTPKDWKFFRTVYFFPQVISGIALATMWRAIYSADNGMLNGLLRMIGYVLFQEQIIAGMTSGAVKG